LLEALSEHTLHTGNSGVYSSFVSKIIQISIPKTMKPQIRTFIFEEIIFIPEPDKFSDDDNLIEAGLDSMGIMRLVMFIEDKFGVTLPDAEIDPDNLHSLNAIEQWILRHKA
jgi:acyl carrier protein